MIEMLIVNMLYTRAVWNVLGIEMGGKEQVTYAGLMGAVPDTQRLADIIVPEMIKRFRVADLENSVQLVADITGVCPMLQSNGINAVAENAVALWVNINLYRGYIVHPVEVAAVTYANGAASHDTRASYPVITNTNDLLFVAESVHGLFRSATLEINSSDDND